MLEIHLFVLVIQIGFNAALNNRGYSSNPLIPTARFANTAQTRRLADSDSYYPSRGSSASNEMPEPEYDSFEDYSFRSVQPVQNPYLRRNDYLRYKTRPDNDVSLETAPVGRINSNNYAESVQSSSSSSRRTHPNYRRPYSGLEPDDHDQGQPRKYNRMGNDDSSLDISSLESSNFEDASQEEDSYVDSLLSLIEQSYKSRGQNRKYYRKGNSLSDDASPIDKLDAEEDAVHSPNSQNKRRNYRKEYNNQYELRVSDSSDKDIPDGYIDTVLLVTDKNLPDVIPVGRPKSGSLDLDDDVSNNLSPFRGLKPGLKSLKLTNDGPLTRSFNRKNDDNLRSSLHDELFSDDDKTGQLTFLRLSSLEDLNLESPLLRSHDQNGLNNRKSNSRNFLRLSLSPNNKLTLDKGIASDLSELLSETLDELNLVPVSLRRTGPSSEKYSRRENRLSAEEDDLTNPSDLRLRSLDNPNSELPIRRYSEPTYRNSKKNVRHHENNIEALKKLFDEDTAKTLVPYHEDKSKNLHHSRRNWNQNNNRGDDFSDEFSLDTLFDFRKEDHDDRLYLDDNLSSDLSVLRSTKLDNLSLKSSLLRSSDENESKPTTDTLNLEYPWIDILGPKNKTDGLRSQTQLRKDKDKTKDSTEILPLEYPWTDILSPSKNTSGLRSLTQLRNGEQEDKINDSSDTLHLEFPWNDELTPGNKKSGKSKSNLRSPKQKHETKYTTDMLYLEYPWNDSLSPENNKSSQSGLRSELRSLKEEDNDKDTTDVLHLEYPWNDQLSPDDNKSTQLRSRDQEDNIKNTTDTLHLEFPWNDELSPDENKTSKSKSLRRQTGSRQDKEPTDELKLEFPWNDKPSPDKPSSKKTAVRTPDPFYVHPYLRNRNIKKHPNYFRRSYDDFSERVRFENPKKRPLKLSNRRLKDNQNLRVLPIARAGPENYKTLSKDSVSVENPNTVIIFPSDRIHKRLRVRRTRRQNNESPPLVTTTEIPNNTDSLVILVGDKSDKKTYNDTIIFPKN